MADKDRRLGRGLESLISAARDKTLSLDVVRRTGHHVQPVPVEEVHPNPYQPRRSFPVEDLNGLVESLRSHGLMQPVVVRRASGGYQLVAGERRWRASRELGWERIDAVIVEADDRQMLEWALIENLQRQDLGPLELGEAFRGLLERYGLTQEELARRLGLGRSSIANMLRLLELPAAIKARVSRGTVSMGAARALLAISNPERQERLAAQVEAGLLTVRQVEDLARLAETPPRISPPKELDPNLRALVEEIQGIFGTRVRIRGTLKRGRVVIEYTSPRQLDGLVRRLRGLAPGFAGPGQDEEEAGGRL